jgi:hypothetical protein
MHIEQLLNEITELKLKVNYLENKLETKGPKSIVFKKKSFLKWPVILLVIVCVLLMTAADISGDKITFTGGTTISATEMNANFNALFGLADGNIGNSNLASDPASLEKVSGGAMKISGANVGIGAPSPDRNLHVYNDGGASILKVESANYNSANLLLTTPDSGDAWVSNKLNGLGISVGGSEVITILESNQNVGIGDANPNSELEVNGRIVSATKYIDASSDNEDVSGVNVLLCNTSSGTITLGGLSGGVNCQILHIVNTGSGDLIFEYNEASGTQKFVMNPPGVDLSVGWYGSVTAVYYNNWFIHD